MSVEWIAAGSAGVRITVKVHPRARREGVRGVHGGVLKVEVTAPAEGGAANRAVEALLARALDVPRNSVSVVHGAASRVKVVEASGIDLERARRRILAAV